MTTTPLDLLLLAGENGVDLALEGGDLVVDSTPRSAFLVSVFSDARANLEHEAPPDNSEDPRGWWAEGDDRYGSRLWLRSRAKLTDETVELVRQDVVAALAWAIEEDLVERIEVATSRVESRYTPGLLAVDVVLERGLARGWGGAWEALELVQYDLPGLRLRLLAP